MTEEQKDRLWELIDTFAGANQVLAISGIYGNYEPEEFDELRRAKADLNDFMESI